MPIESTRRGFLKGLLGLTVVAIVPLPGDGVGQVPAVDPYAIKAPEGTTYQWVRTALFGEPDPENVRLRLTNGWTFVAPDAHAGAPTSKLGDAVERGGLVLMQKPTVDVQAELAAERRTSRFTREWERVKPNYPGRTGVSIRGWDHIGIKSEEEFDA